MTRTDPHSPHDPLFKKAEKIKLLVLDVDGVLTDGSIVLDSEGNELKSFHVRDGHGIVMLRRGGVEVALITGRRSAAVSRRAEELGINDVYQNCFDKKTAYRELLKKYSLKDSEVAYIGDDIVDIPVMKSCGLAVAVADADEEIRTVAAMTTRNNGGRGAVREVCEVLLKARGRWRAIIDELAEA
jgi:3-deoxy-D-manno-octulosonate 8-phosphate phosphatase (KDO 8-P phosphatase)